MKVSVAITAFLTGMGITSADMITTTKDNAVAAAVQPTNNPPICKFDPVKGEYICPDVSRVSISDEGIDVTKDTAFVAAADCHKCQHDWDDCMKKWGCWFYDCNNACKCLVVKNDPSCKDCSSGQCHA